MSEAAEQIATTEATEATSAETTATEAVENTETVDASATSEETTAEGSTDDVGEETTEAAEQTEEAPTAVNLQKMADDNKAWATKVSQENGELKRRIEAMQQTPKIITPEIAEALKSLSENAKTIGETYGEEVGGGLDKRDRILLQIAQGVANMEAQTDRAFYASELTEAGHGDYVQVMNSEAFQTWAETQPPLIQAAVLSDNPQDAAYGLNLYKEFSGSTAAKEARAAATAAANARKAETKAPGTGSGPPASTKKKYTSQDIAKMSKEEYAKNYKNILANYER